MNIIIEVWNVRATGTRGIGHYIILLEEGTHLCTCLLLLNKGLVCRHFFRVGTYSRYATFHISIIPTRWYMDTTQRNVQRNDLLQQYPPIPVCDKISTENNAEFERSVSFHYFYVLQNDSCSSKSVGSSNKAIYAELSGLAKKSIDYALRINMRHELLNILRSFIYDAQIKMDGHESEMFTNITNPAITKHKGRPPKRFKASVEQFNGSRVNRVLKDSTQDNMRTEVEEEACSSKGRRCGNCREYGHYAKTCPNVV